MDLITGGVLCWRHTSRRHILRRDMGLRRKRVGAARSRWNTRARKRICNTLLQLQAIVRRQDMIEYSVWMLLGGRKADGTFNRTVYISYNNGVNWATGATSLQLPEEIPAMVGVDNIVSAREMSANISDAWKKSARRQARIKGRDDGDIVTWEMPPTYICSAAMRPTARFTTRYGRVCSQDSRSHR